MRRPFHLSIAFAALLGGYLMSTGCAKVAPARPTPAARPVAATAPVVDAPGKRLIYAIIGPNRDPARAVALVHQAADVNEGTPNFPPIYAAAASPEMLNVLKALVARGANLDERGTGGFTALHQASARSNRKAAEFLIDSGADIEARAQGAVTPLHAGVSGEIWNNSTAACEVLLAHGADVNARDALGRTPLDYALQHYSTRTEERSRAFAWARSSMAAMLRAHGGKPAAEIGAPETRPTDDARQEE